MMFDVRGWAGKYLSRSMKSGRRHRTQTTGRSRWGVRPRFEYLEQRRVLSANQVFLDGATSTIRIEGSSVNDSATVSITPDNSIRVQLETADGYFQSTFLRQSVAAVIFSGGDGDDRFQNFTDLPSVALGEAGNDVLTGGSGSDWLSGGDGDDALSGGEGSDLISGGDGNDWISGWTGNDSLIGGPGDDYVVGGQGNDSIDGGSGADQLLGEEGDDTLDGGEGADELFGGLGNDRLAGGAGDDRLSGEEGNDSLFGGEGDDWLSGWTGDDALYGDVGNDYLIGAEGNDSLSGGDGNDELYGGEGNDWLSGWLGNDKLIGAAGNDYAVGGAGDDYVEGGDGDDELHGDDGNDHLRGGNGNDVLVGGSGDDSVFGGAGDDYLHGEAGIDVLRGEDGNDWLSGWIGSDELYGGYGNDYLIGGADDDRLSGEDGDDTLLGDDGNDWLSGWTGNDVLFGGAGKDFLTGGEGDDWLHGERGDDELQGGPGNDWLSGWDGNDTLAGDSGNDYLIGGLGDDRLSGEDGHDELDGGEGNDWLSGWTGNDALYGGLGDDYLTGGDGDDALIGGDGNDELHGNNGNDWLWGSAGNDQLYGELGDNYLVGEVGDDVLVGSFGNDLLDGGSGNDELIGGDGDDVLIGGMGQDELRGETGFDLLLGGTTAYELQADRYWVIMQAWSPTLSYTARIQQLEDQSFTANLRSEYTVFDDGVTDYLTGGSELDWFFITGSMPAYRPADVVSDENGNSDQGGHNHALIVDTLPPLEGFELVDSLDSLIDRQADESIHSVVPHAANLTLQREHLSLFQLVRYDQVTHYAVRSGNWSNPTTWANGLVPTSGAHVLVPIDVRVEVDSVVTARISTVRVDGTLNFAADRNNELRVETLVVGGRGSFQMGTAEKPIAPGVQAKLLITDSGAIDRQSDPFGLSRGLLAHGTVTIHGAQVESSATLAGAVVAGTQTLNLKAAPTGWKVGDTIVVAATTAGSEQNEVRTVLAISGTSVLLDRPLSYTHVAPAANLEIHVANTTRNAIIASESTVVDRRGHVMFMHNRSVDIAYAGFYKLGRTDKSRVLNDPVVGADWTLQPGTGTNGRGRYAVHFHRNGLTDDGNPAVIMGSAVVDSPGWGFVNHSSNVDMIQNVAFDVHGAAFATEVGDEIGGFYGNIAIGSKGSGEADNSREFPFQDFGHQGDGFWFQGAGIAVVGNVSAGNEGNAFAYYTRGLYESKERARFLSANLADPSIANNATTIDVGLVPVVSFRDNAGYASAKGLLIRYHLHDSTHGQSSYFENSSFWNNTVGVMPYFTQDIVLRNLQVIHVPDGNYNHGILAHIVDGNITYENLVVTGYHTGINMPRWGNNIVRGGHFNNAVHDILLPTAAWHDRSVLITGLSGTPKITLFEDLWPIQYNDASVFFVTDRVVLDFGAFDDLQVYYLRQHANLVPFPDPRPDVPAIYVGKTNQFLWDNYGMALSGAIAPLNAYTVWYIQGGLIPLSA